MRRMNAAVAALLILAACKDDPPKSTRPTASVAAPPPVVSAPPPKPTRPPKDANVLLITVDCLRADMPWAGYARPIAPNLTKLAERAVVYTHAYSTSSYTSMSLGGFLAGKVPGELKRDGYFFGTYAPDNLFFPEVLSAAKVHTVSAHAHGYFKDAGFQQGFDVWDVVPNLKWNNTTDENVTGPELEALAEKQLGALGEDQRFFAWYHFLDPHDQYMSHEGIDWGKTLRDRYDAEVTYADRAIGKLLEFVAGKPWGARTIIILTADHGEAFGDHGRYLHGFELWESLIRVPLFFVVPGAEPHRIDVNRSALDMAPTILDLFGLPKEPTFEGTSLVPEIFGDKPAERDVVVDLPQTSDNDRRRALLHGTKKLISFGMTDYLQLFDLTADPEEKSPIQKGEDFDAVATLYRALQKTLKDVPATSCKASCLNGGYGKAKDAAAP